MSDGKESYLGSIVQAKLFTDARDVVLGCFFADKKLLADLSIIQASSYQWQDLAFSGTQTRQRVGLAAKTI